MPPIKANTANSGFVGLIFGAKKSNNAPKMISANPPLFRDLLC